MFRLLCSMEQILYPSCSPQQIVVGQAASAKSSQATSTRSRATVSYVPFLHRIHANIIFRCPSLERHYRPRRSLRGTRHDLPHNSARPHSQSCAAAPPGLQPGSPSSLSRQALKHQSRATREAVWEFGKQESTPGVRATTHEEEIIPAKVMS